VVDESASLCDCRKPAPLASEFSVSGKFYRCAGCSGLVPVVWACEGRAIFKNERGHEKPAFDLWSPT
jgi:hypothetical protein